MLMLLLLLGSLFSGFDGRALLSEYGQAEDNGKRKREAKASKHGV